MSKVFTITEGLENLGALKTGGQGSIYRARRIGPIITAVKLLPTPILSEDMADKNYRDFRNEVEKLKKVNELPNPNVVCINNFGISETGSFPFIEMEFIEGPDLEELLQPPHDPVFTIKETIRVAEHLANALAHCHRVAVKHGDIKSNNVKFNVHTGNYVLLDFGLALMSDEQRRTSLRHAGAVEFMAPEQSEGRLLFESDVYSYGVILYELLAGQVPFPLENKNETTRNMVLVAHMETPPPDILPLRAAHMPDAWPEERRAHEMQVPQWLLDMIRKCMEKVPENRFKNGVALYEYILHHSTAIAGSSELTELLRQENKKLREENLMLQKQVKSASAPPAFAAPVSEEAIGNEPSPAKRSSWPLPALAAAVLGAIATFFILEMAHRPGDKTSAIDSIEMARSTVVPANPHTMRPKDEKGRVDTVYVKNQQAEAAKGSGTDGTTTQTPTEAPFGDEGQSSPLKGHTKQYLVTSSRAYFYDRPDADSRRDAYLTPSDEVMTAIDEDGDYVYIVFTNDEGQTSKGWVLKRDLNPVE